jgi:hypothetical protein
MEKSCSKCARRLPYSEFFRKKGGADGLYSYCKVCTSAQAAEYRQRKADQIAIQRAIHREQNREELAAKSREWAAKNPEYVKTNAKKYYEKNKEYRAGYNAAWHKANADALRPYYAEKSRRRFAKLRHATPRWANAEAILAIYEKCRDISVETGVKHHVDHIVPLVSPLVCGLHVEWNLQILTACDNLSKSNKFEPGPYPCL